ncbi:MAG: DUF3488 domain-containing protein [Promethearchaeota archaeon]
MLIIDNLKKLIEKRNMGYLILVIWLLAGIVAIQFFPIVGIVIFLPFLTFLMFLYLLSLFAKKDIRDIAPWKVILLLIASLPVMLIISLFLFALFAASIVSYMLMTSWFILYGLILTSKSVDSKLKKLKGNKFTRGVEFFGGIAVSIAFLVLFVFAPLIDVQKLIFKDPLPLYLEIYINITYLIVAGTIIGIGTLCFIHMFKKKFNAWYGIFCILAAGYTFFLALKVFLGLSSLESDTETTLLTEIGLLLADLFIIVYAISTLLGTQAERLAKKLKRVGLDTVFIWLLFSKASYEFIVNFPYDLLFRFTKDLFGDSAAVIPLLDVINFLNEDVINLAKNIAVLFFFIVLFVLLGLWEIRKYNREQAMTSQELKSDETSEIAALETTSMDTDIKLVTEDFIDKEEELSTSNSETVETIDSEDHDEDSGSNDLKEP